MNNPFNHLCEFWLDRDSYLCNALKKPFSSAPHFINEEPQFGVVK